MKKFLLFMAVLLCVALTKSFAQTISFSSPANQSLHAASENIYVQFEVAGDLDSVQLWLKGAGSQRYIPLTVSDGWWSANLPQLTSGNYKLYALVFLDGQYSVSGLQFSVSQTCCSVQQFSDPLNFESFVDQDNGWELDMSNYNVNPNTFGFLRYDALGETSIGSLSNISTDVIQKSNLSQVQVSSANDQSFSIFSSSNDLIKQRFGNAGIYGYGTADYENGGSGISYEVSDSTGNSMIEQYATGIDVKANNFNVVSDTVYVNSNNIIFSSTPTINGDFPFSYYSFGNGLYQQDNQVGLGGTNGIDAIFTPADGNNSLALGELSYNNSSGNGAFTSYLYNDTSEQESGINFQTYTPDNFQNFSLFADNWTNSGNYSSANIYGYSGAEGVGLSLVAGDSSSHNESNGIQIYANGIDLNAAKVQLNYYPNSGANDLILTTDSVGNIIQKQFSSFQNGSTYFSDGNFYVGNGLTLNGNEIDLGGNNGFDAMYLPQDGSGQTGYGEYGYDNVNDQWNIQAIAIADSLWQVGRFNVGIMPSGTPTSNNQNFDLLVGDLTAFPNGISVAEINGHAGTDGAGMSLIVRDSTGTSEDNGIQIYNNGIDLNTPGIQLNYFPNTPAMDSVLVTDSAGNLKQKAFSSFGLGGSHWQYNGYATIDTVDNVGIGIWNPQAKLAVNGTIMAQKIKVTQNLWPDYVFDSAYQLLSIETLEKYLQQNKHLPNIPSASDVSKNGVDLGDNQAALLRKIEELTLYTIDQNKKIADQNTKLQLLEEKLNRLLQSKN